MEEIKKQYVERMIREMTGKPVIYFPHRNNNLYSGIVRQSKIEGSSTVFEITPTDRRLDKEDRHYWWHMTSMSPGIVTVPPELLKGEITLEDFLKAEELLHAELKSHLRPLGGIPKSIMEAKFADVIANYRPD